ncbi:MAG: ABC transporter permease [Planctomycetota bacterium]|nr:ABC transporter permease [Planctomycetota bacterium]
MTALSPTTPDDLAAPRGRGLWADAARRLRRDRSAMLCLGVILLYIGVAVGAAAFLGGWNESYDYARANEDPSWDFWLGTDNFGRSTFQELLLGAKVSLTVALLTNLIAVPLGIALGALAGYYGGVLDDLIVWLLATLAAVPEMIRLIALRFAFSTGPLFGFIDMSGVGGLCLALAVTSWIGTCRYVRAETMKIRQLDYVLAARAIGTSGPGILARHVLPNVVHIGIINFSLGMVGAIMAEVVLTYLGLGLTGQPSWGQMIAHSQAKVVVGQWRQLAAATTAIFFLVLALNILGDRLRDALDPRLKNA